MPASFANSGSPNTRKILETGTVTFNRLTLMGDGAADMSLSDAEIVDGLKEGSKTSLRSLVRKYQDRLYSYALKHLNNDKEITVSVVSDTLMKVFQKIDTFQFENSEKDFSSWVFRILHNKIVDYNRKDQRIKERFQLVPYDESTSAQDNTNSSGKVEVEKRLVTEYGSIGEREDPRKAKLLAAIENLGERDRIIVKCRSSGMSDKETGKICGMNSDHVRIYYKRCIDRLKKMIEG